MDHAADAGGAGGVEERACCRRRPKGEVAVVEADPVGVVEDIRAAERCRQFFRLGKMKRMHFQLLAQGLCRSRGIGEGADLVPGPQKALGDVLAGVSEGLGDDVKGLGHGVMIGRDDRSVNSFRNI